MEGKTYIEKQVALDCIENINWYHVNSEGKLMPGAGSEADAFVRYETVEAVLKCVPEFKVPVGEWLEVDEMYDAFDCSVCDAMVSKRTNYCPRCGARMKKLTNVR